jgi:hypothetical protein
VVFLLLLVVVVAVAVVVEHTAVVCLSKKRAIIIVASGLQASKQGSHSAASRWYLKRKRMEIPMRDGSSRAKTS